MAEYINPQWQLPNNKGGVKDNNFSLDFTWPGSINSGYAIGSQKKYSFSIWFRWTKDGNPTASYSFIFGAASSGNAEDYRAALGLALVSSQVRFYITMGNGTGSGGYYWNSSQTVPANLLNGEWHHLVLNVNETGQDLYIDNSLFYQYLYSVPGTGGASVGNPTTGTPGTSNYFIGNNGTAAPPRNNLIAHAEMSNFAIFDYELNTGQIASLYGSAANGSGNPMGLASPPIAYYPLGNAASPNGLLLVPNAALQDYVFDFSGNKTVGLSQNINLGSQSTISYWVKTTNSIGNYIQNNGGNLINTGPYSGYEYYTFKPNNSAGGAGMFNSNINTYILSTNWVHWTVVRNGTGCELYANGQSIETATVANWSGYDTIVSGLGKNASGIVGDASNFLFWNTNLSSTEVETLYNYGSPIQTLASIPQNSNLKAWYKLDASEVYNSTTTEWEIENASSAFQSFLNIPNPTGSTVNRIDTNTVFTQPSFTVSVWFIADTGSSANQPIVSTRTGNGGSSKGFTIKIESNLLYWEVYNAGQARAYKSFSPSSNWHNALLSYDGPNKTVYGYLDGEFVMSDYFAGGYLPSGDTLAIGDYRDTQHSFNGSVSNTSFWNTNLSTSQAQEVYGGGNPPDLLSHSAASNLVSWWKLDNTTTGLEDSKGSNNATNYGAVKVSGSVSTLSGTSTGMSQSNLVQSDLLTTTSYSPYALQFDGISDKIDCGVSPFDETTGDITISAWVKRTSAVATYAPIVSATQGVSGATTQFSFQFYGNSLSLFWKGLGGTDLEIVPTSAFTVANDVWYLINFVRTGTTGRFYVNGNFIHLSTKTYDDLYSTGIPNLSIGAWWFSSNAGVTGSISNVALWNTSLSAAELREVYNEGRPSNLNNFSGTAPIHWWQLGSNSSFTSPDWTCLDEIGSSNGISSNMIENRIVNGVGSSSNGVSTNMNLANNISGSSPNGEANGLSVNMTLANITGGVN